MNNTVKSLIIIIVVLVAVLGIAGGIFLQGYLNSSNKNVTSVNSTNNSVNNSSNQTKANNSNSKTETTQKLISSQEAISIVNKNVSAYGLTSYGAK